MNKNNMVLENASLFLDFDQAISQLTELILRCEHSDLLMVVRCQEAMPVANQIARELSLSVVFSASSVDTETRPCLDIASPIYFDYEMVKESGRDLPQDVILHEEKNLRANLISIYEKTYEEIVSDYPGKIIIMVDELTNIDAAFFPRLTGNYMEQSSGNGFSEPVTRRFIFLHAANRKSGNTATPGFDIIIEHSFDNVDKVKLPI
jgi:hypothetical protein